LPCECRFTGRFVLLPENNFLCGAYSVSKRLLSAFRRAALRKVVYNSIPNETKNLKQSLSGLLKVDSGDEGS